MHSALPFMTVIFLEPCQNSHKKLADNPTKERGGSVGGGGGGGGGRDRQFSRSIETAVVSKRLN